MSTITNEIATLLEREGFGVIGKSIFVSTDQPPKPDFIIQILNAGTSLPDYPSIDISHPAIQIKVRGGKGQHQFCEETIFEIKDYLKSLSGKVIYGSRYIYINHLSGPVDIGTDSTMRPSYSVNFYTMRTEAISTQIGSASATQTGYSSADVSEGLHIIGTVGSPAVIRRLTGVLIGQVLGDLRLPAEG